MVTVHMPVNAEKDLRLFMNYKQSFKADMPYDRMYQASRKEASRKKPVFFIHKYFARRITANFRMSLLGFMAGERDNLYEDFYKPSERGSLQEPITVLDPFMGGGTAIFEALRFGCKVIGNDLQPLSLFVTRALVEPVDEDAVNRAVKRLEKTVGRRIKSYYETICPCCGKKADGMYVFHVKKAKTESSCKEHRFFSSFVIAYKKDEFTIVCPKCGKLHKTKLEHGKYECDCGWVLHSPKDSYIKNGVFECPVCHEQKVLSEYESGSGYPFLTDIIAIEYDCPHCKAHDYKAPDADDQMLRQKAMADYNRIKSSLPVPEQDIPAGFNTNQILNHGYRKFRDLFNDRQLLCLGLLLQAINEIRDKSVQLWLQLAFSGMLEMNNMFCRYQQNAYKICNIFLTMRMSRSQCRLKTVYGEPGSVQGHLIKRSGKSFAASGLMLIYMICWQRSFRMEDMAPYRLKVRTRFVRIRLRIFLRLTPFIRCFGVPIPGTWNSFRMNRSIWC